MLVSVIIPYFNRPEKLERCIDSIHAQTYSQVEIIVIDDCSDSFSAALKLNIVYYRNSENIGPGGSRNKGMELAKGAYVAFLDCDDYWHPEFLQKCLETFKESDDDTAMVYTNTLSVDGDQATPKRDKAVVVRTILPTIFSKGRYWATSSCLWNSEIIKNSIWLNTRCWEDYAFDTSVALVSNKIAHVNENLVYYDVSGDDKLSKQVGDGSVLEKTKSVLAIARSITDSKMISSESVNGLTKHVLNSLILQKKYRIANNEIRSNSLESIKILKGNTMLCYLSLVLKLSERISLYLLRKFRRQL